ncbi:probable WRKY transcription factor 70 [Tanacetum coccineum]
MEVNKKKLVETLIKGRNSAKRLQTLLHQKVSDDELVSVDGLVDEISESFYDGLSVLTPTSTHLSLACDHVFHGKPPPPANKERRGCYKRRKILDSRKEVSGTIGDGYSWRKYGQKEILNSKFPRCYFRCAHKHIQGCNALKQVQQLEDDSNMFEITYIGHHTCAPPNTPSHHRVVLDSKKFKNRHYSQSNPSISTNNQNDAFLKQEDLCYNVSLANEAQLIPALVWNEILTDKFESFKSDQTLSDISFDDVMFS